MCKSSWTQQKREALKMKTEARAGFLPTVPLESYPVLLLVLSCSRSEVSKRHMYSPRKSSFAWTFLDIYLVIISFNCYFKILPYRYTKGKGK